MVYGSVATGEERETSDIDWLIIGDFAEEAVVKAIGEAESRIEPALSTAGNKAASSRFSDRLQISLAVISLGGMSFLATLKPNTVHLTILRLSAVFTRYDVQLNKNTTKSPK